MSQIYRKPKLFGGKHVKQKTLARREEARKIVPIALDTGRSGHVNLLVNVSRGGVYKSVPVVKQKDRHGNYIMTGEIDFEVEFERERERNLELINTREGKLRSGKNKGEKVIKYEVNNPPRKRYFPYAWK